MEFAVKQWEWDGPKLCGKTCEAGDDAIRDRTLLSPVFAGLVTRLRLHPPPKRSRFHSPCPKGHQQNC